MHIKQIILSEQYKGIIPRPTAEEYDALKQNIREEGVRVSLIVNSKNVLLDGYTRYQIAGELGIKDIPVETRSFKSQSDEIAFIISLNLNRRHLNTAQKAEIGLLILDAEREKAKKRMLAGKKIDPNQNSDQGMAADIAASRVGVSRDTIHKAKMIKEMAATDEDIARLWQKALNGDESINHVHGLAKIKERCNACPELDNLEGMAYVEGFVNWLTFRISVTEDEEERNELIHIGAELHCLATKRWCELAWEEAERMKSTDIKGAIKLLLEVRDYVNNLTTDFAEARIRHMVELGAAITVERARALVEN